MMRFRAMSLLFAAAMLAGLTGCGGGGSSGGSSGGGGGGGGGGNPPPPSATISGVAGTGPLLDAIVTFYPISNGAAGTTAITSVRTDSQTGSFSTSVSASGPVLVTVTTDSKTQMLDELSGTAVPAPSGLVLHAVLDGVTSVTQPIAVSPLTEMAYQIASSASGGLTTANSDAAFTAVDNLFLDGAPALYTQPIAVTDYKNATAAEQELAKLSTALAVAANGGTATDSSGSACAGSDYGSRLTCALSGLGNLVQNGTGSSPALTAAAQYFGSSYTQLDDNDVQIAGGQPPSALGLDAPTQAETTLQAALASQSPFPGYSAGGTAVANTKALFADVRTNILDAASPQNPSGLAPQISAVASDFRTNVQPTLSATGRALIAMQTAASLLAAAATSPQAASTANLDGPNALAIAPDGNIFSVNGGSGQAPIPDEPTVVLVGSNGEVQPFANTASYAPIFLDSTTGYYGTFGGLAVSSAGNVFTTYLGENSGGQIGSTFELSPYGGLADTLDGTVLENAAAQYYGAGTTVYLGQPTSLAFDGHGNLYIADDFNRTIDEVTAAATAGLSSATVTTVAATPAADTYGSVCGLAVDGSGNIYFSDCLDAIYEVSTSGAVSLFAGTATTSISQEISGSNTIYICGTQPCAGLNDLTVDGAGNVYVAAAYDDTIVKATPAGTLSTIAGQTGVPGFQDGQGSAALLNVPLDVKMGSAGELYVADLGNDAIREIDASGNVTTLAKGAAAYRASKSGTYCAYGPSILGTAANVAQCVYTVSGGSVLMTVTQTGSGTYDVKTQPLSSTPNPNYQAGQNPIIDAYQVASADAALDGTLTQTGTAGPDVPAGSFSGQLYVDSSGGSITASLTVGVSSDWNGTTDSGTLTLNGSLANGQGGIGLQSATIGADSSLTVQNIQPLLHGTKLSALTTPASVQGTLDVSGVTTSAFVYGGKVTIGAPVADKSGKYEIPSSLSVTGTIAQVASGGGTTPLFTGTVSVSAQGIGSFDATQPYSSTNYVTATAMLSGNLSLNGGRVLDVSAEVKGGQSTPTPAQADSLTATYSYSTPAGTLALNATGTYDATNGFAATVTNSSGVTVTLAQPVGGALTGTATVGGQTTATIAGATIDYSDGTSESLY
jgi:hypothetical protein